MFAGLFISIYYIITVQSIPWIIFWGVVFSFFSVHLASIQHDAGHRAIFKSARMNDLMGHLCCFFLAMGYTSWKIKHSIHHAHTNQEDMDPDVDLPILSFTPEQYRQRKGIQKFLSKYQVYLYYPIGSLVSFSVRITSAQYFVKKFKKKYIGEIIIFVISLIIMFIFPFYFFSIAKALTLFVVVNFAIGLYLFNVFAPNHKGMPVVEKNQKLSFLQQQIMTSRNIGGSAFTDFMFMGLNYQIEHHLFPNCPRNKLKHLSPYIKRVCKDMRIEYTEVSVIEMNRIILSELQSVVRNSA